MALDPNRWTQKTQEAINRALDTAKAESNPEVTPDHLLAALLGQEEGIVLPIVQRLGKTPLELRNAAANAIAFAYARLGTPYEWGGTGVDGRFDCSGLTQAAYASAGVTLPRTSREQWYAGAHLSRDQLQPGDLVFYATNLNDPRTIHHVGIYVARGYMVDAPHTGAVIRFDPVDQPDYIGAVRPGGR